MNPTVLPHGPTADLTDAEIVEMHALLDRHFEGVDPKVFRQDLREKTHVLRVWKDGKLAGFSTLLAWRTRHAGEACNVLYSGDTIMSPESWNSPALAKAWIAMVRQVQAALPEGRCWWLLLSSGFRTYRFLPVFWREFWPRHEAATPQPVRALLDELARQRFGDRYDPQNGVVRFTCPHRLRGPLAIVPDGKRMDPHVAFFLQRNPGWREGDELVCLTEIADANLTPTGRRMIRERDKGLP